MTTMIIFLLSLGAFALILDNWGNNMTNNLSYNAWRKPQDDGKSYNVCIKPRGYGKSYELMQELRKINGKQTNTQKTR